MMSTSKTDENIEAVMNMILDNRQITASEVANNIGIQFGACQAIFTDVLGMKRAAPKIVPKLLNFEQKQLRMDIAQADEFLAKNKTVIMPQPPYSLDLASAVFFLFSKLKTLMKGKRFATIEKIKEKS